MMTKQFALILLTFMLLMIGCKASPVLEIQETTIATKSSPSPTLMLTNTVEPTYTTEPTQTSEPTITPTLTTTATPTATVDPRFFGTLTQPFVLARTGPGTIYPSTFLLGFGIKIEVIGKSIDRFWYQLNLNFGQTGWIKNTQINIDGNTANLVILEAPPTPIPTNTPAPNPEISLNPWYYSNGGPSFDITIKDFPVGERITIQVNNLTTGEIGSGKTRPSGKTGIDITPGNVNGLRLRVLSNGKSGDTIQVVITGTLGSYATILVTIP